MRSFLLTLVLFLSITTVCNGEPLVDPPNGGILRGALSSDILNWDPAFAVDTKTGLLISLVYGTLFAYDHASLDVVPNIVEKWSVSEDGLVYVFTLMDGIRFVDGSLLTAEDVVYSWSRLADPATGSPRSWLFDDVESFEAPDRRSVSIVLRKPIPLLYILTMPNTAIVPKGSSDELTLYPLGSGPWQLESWERDEKIVLRASPNYLGDGPYLERIQFTILSELVSYLWFEAGRLDWVAVSAPVLPSWEKKYSERLIYQSKANIYYVGLNNQKFPLNNADVRRALNYGADQELLTRSLLHGSGTPAYGPVPPIVGGSTVPKYQFDPKQAGELLAAAGVSSGFQMELWLVSDPVLLAIGEALKAQWAEIGVEIKIVLNDFSGIQEATSQGEVDAFLLGWTMDYPLAQNFLEPTFSQKNLGAGGNRAFFADSEVEDLISQGLWKEVEERVRHLAPWVFLWHGLEVTAVQPWVKDFRPHVSYYGNNFTSVRIEETK